MLDKLKEEVYLANLELVKQNLIKYTWGNVSGVDREQEVFVIKPSGVAYDKLKVEDMVVCDFDGNVVEGKLSPSSDTKTHAIIYKNFPEVGGIVHTHSQWATIYAQAGKPLTAYGTTHADTFYGSVPCARFLTKEEIDNDYERETGNVIVETFRDLGLDEMQVPGILLNGHGPFTWAHNASEAVYNAVVLEEVAKTAYFSQLLTPNLEPLPQAVLDKHYLRKHGKDSYYGQKEKNNE